jgi:3-hydroxyisobutyrate dehydrogenase-like beta-hydroxyacid dehydrogenase
MSMDLPHRIALIGFGEVGQTLAADLLQVAGVSISTWDRLLTTPGSTPHEGLKMLPRVHGAPSMHAAVSDAPLVICAVTAGECGAAAREAAPALQRDAFYFDLNSVSPAAKQEAAGLIDAAGACFVEAAIMSPIAPKRCASPMLLGGPHAQRFLPPAQALGFAGAQVFSGEIGRASAAKMCRSIMIKGMEALLTESLLSARRHGVEGAVLESLQDLFPKTEWRTLARYMLSRSIQHGARRAEEMREAAQTAAEAGVTPWMSRACVERQAWAAARGEALRHEQLLPLLDALLEESTTA